MTSLSQHEKILFERNTFENSLKADKYIIELLILPGHTLQNK